MCVGGAGVVVVVVVVVLVVVVVVVDVVGGCVVVSTSHSVSMYCVTKSSVLVLGASVVFVAADDGVGGCVVGVIDDIVTGNDINSGRSGARIVDDNTYGRSVYRSKSLS